MKEHTSAGFFRRTGSSDLDAARVDRCQQEAVRIARLAARLAEQDLNAIQSLCNTRVPVTHSRLEG